MGDHLVSLHRARPKDLMANGGRWAKAPRPTPDNPLIISASELGTFLRCRVKHNWGYRCQLEPVDVDPDRGLGLGLLGHDIVARWYQSPPAKRTVKRMNALAKKVTAASTFKDLSSEQRALTIAMCTGYAEMTIKGAENFPTDRAIGLAKAVAFPEEWFEVPLNEDGSILVRGRFDIRFVPTNDRKCMALNETKTRKDFRDEYIEMTLQNTVYLFAMWRKWPGRERYVMYFQRMRKQMPSPRVKAPLFDRQEIDRDEWFLKQWAQDAAQAALDMLDGAIYPNPMDSCAWSCEFKQPCLLRGHASDLKHVLKSEYKPREKR